MCIYLCVCMRPMSGRKLSDLEKNRIEEKGEQSKTSVCECVCVCVCVLICVIQVQSLFKFDVKRQLKLKVCFCAFEVCGVRERYIFFFLWINIKLIIFNGK